MRYKALVCGSQRESGSQVLIPHTIAKHYNAHSNAIVDDQAYINKQFFTQHDSYDTIPYAEDPLYYRFHETIYIKSLSYMQEDTTLNYQLHVSGHCSNYKLHISGQCNELYATCNWKMH
jgi:hypothetical protein